jgi:hypothetical protein
MGATARDSARFWSKTLLLSVFVMAAIPILVVTLSPHLPVPLLGGWWKEAAPFEDVRWVGDAPQVLVDGQWYGLVAINGLEASEITRFCKSSDPRLWRKRFSEDLVQVLNRMDPLGTRATVDLELRDLRSLEPIVRSDVALSVPWRNAIRDRRYSWPWERAHPGGTALRIRSQGRDWDLVSVDGVPAVLLTGSSSLFDEYCDQVGRSPGDFIDFVARDPATLELHEFEGMSRFRPELGLLRP